MFIIYDLIFLIIAIVYLPIYLFRGKFHRGFFLRLGILPKNLELNQPIWIHAVSVGEAKVIKGLLEELRKAYPGKRFVISTTTPTGNKVVQGIAQKTDYITYLPLDFSFIVRAVIEKIQPSLFIIAETEIWPNLIWRLSKNKIPIIVVNGRISDKSFRGYLSIKFLLRPILNKVTLFCMQTSRDAARLMRLGAQKEKVCVTGNMKFDIMDYTDSKIDYTDYRGKLGLESNAKLLVAASTHPGEEEIILNAYQELLNRFPNLRLLIASRHPERAKEIEKLLFKRGFQSIFISNFLRTTPACRTGRDDGIRNTEYGIRTTVFILDTIGQLLSFYSIADIVFVGGSLIKKGGQNILEPATSGKPILFGPYMFNFRDIAKLFLENQAAILVRSQEELKEKIEYLLNNPNQAHTQGQRAKEVVFKNQGATLKTLEYIKISAIMK